MKAQFASGFIPYEIGDTVKLKEKSELYTITQMKMIQYIPSGEVEFEVEISPKASKSLSWIKPDLIEMIVNQNN